MRLLVVCANNSVASLRGGSIIIRLTGSFFGRLEWLSFHPALIVCAFHIRDDAKYYVDSFFNKDKSHLTDKLSLCKKVLNLGNRIENLPKYGDEAGQLVFCTVIRYLRKVKMEVGLCFSEKEKNRIIPDVIKSIPNGGDDNGD